MIVDNVCLRDRIVRLAAIVKIAVDLQKILFEKNYVVKDVFPELYSAIYPRAKALLGGNADKIHDRLETLQIVFYDKPGKGFSYELGTNIIKVNLPNYILDKVETPDGFINSLRLRLEIGKDFILRDGICMR